MKRRDFLKTTASALLLPRGSYSKSFGWLPPSLPSNEPRFLDTYPNLEGTGKGKVALLYKYLEAILKHPIIPFKQDGPDCTSNAGGMGIDFLAAIQSLLKKDKWLGRTSTEMLHVGSRGKRKTGGITVNELIKFATEHGILIRKKYVNPNDQEDTWDFRKYNYNLCTKLTKNGIPDWLLRECKKYRLTKVTKVSTWTEARDAIFNLNPIVIGSKVGFDNAQRDEHGFAKPKSTWYHAWLLIAIDDKFKQPGGCLISSGGSNWVKGPKRHRQPDGSIWVNQDIIHKMVSEYGDSYALCNLDGLQPTRYQLWLT